MLMNSTMNEVRQPVHERYVSQRATQYTSINESNEASLANLHPIATRQSEPEIAAMPQSEMTLLEDAEFPVQIPTDAAATVPGSSSIYHT